MPREGLSCFEPAMAGRPLAFVKTCAGPLDHRMSMSQWRLVANPGRRPQSPSGRPGQRAKTCRTQVTGRLRTRKIPESQLAGRRPGASYVL